MRQNGIRAPFIKGSLFSFFDGFCQNKLDLRVDGAKVIFSPGCNFVPKRGRQAEKHLLFGLLLFLGGFFALYSLRFHFLNAGKPLFQLLFPLEEIFFTDVQCA